MYLIVVLAVVVVFRVFLGVGWGVNSFNNLILLWVFFFLFCVVGSRELRFGEVKLIDIIVGCVLVLL